MLIYIVNSDATFFFAVVNHRLVYVRPIHTLTAIFRQQRRVYIDNLIRVSLSQVSRHFPEEARQYYKVRLQTFNDVKHYISLWEDAKLQVSDLKDKMTTASDMNVQESEKYKALETKCSELESAYFDLQMENTNLKNEIRNLQKFRGENE